LKESDSTLQNAISRSEPLKFHACNPILLSAARIRIGSRSVYPDSLMLTRRFQTGSRIAASTDMWLWKLNHNASKSNANSLEHRFVLGPLRPHRLFSKPARLYYCRRCRWSFLVSGRKVVVLNTTGDILADPEDQRRLDTFPEGSCPVLEALSHDAEKDHGKVLIVRPEAANRSREPTSSGIFPWARRATPVFFSLSRLH